jgi:hypothetical protein
MENNPSSFIHDPEEPPAPWFQVPRAFIRNPKISFEAKGLMTYLMSHSQNFNISIPHIVKTQNISKDRIYKIINECIENGYLKREYYSEKGLRRFKYLISPTGRFKKCLPCPENPDPADQDQVKPDRKIEQSSSSEEEKIDQLEEHSLSLSLSQKKEESEWESYGIYVRLKKEDYKNFCKEYGQKNIDRLIEEMNDWISSRGNKYNDFAAEIRTWIRRRKWDRVREESEPIEVQSEVKEMSEKERVVNENFVWTDRLLMNKENIIFLNNLRIMIFGNRIEIPEIPEAVFYYDSPGYRSCAQNVLEKLKTKDYTKKSGYVNLEELHAT